VAAVVESFRFSQKSMQAHSSSPCRDYHLLTSTSRYLPSNHENYRDTHMVPAKETQRRVWVQYKDGQHDACAWSMDDFITTKSRSVGDLPPVTMHCDFTEANTSLL
jgi:hypothetical protein